MIPAFGRRVCLALLCAATVANGRVAVAQGAFSINYTGKLLGYARVPDKQVDDAAILGCTGDAAPSAAATTGSTIAKALLSSWQQAGTTSPAILVGIGDNFSPELDSRQFENGRLKEYYTFDYAARRWVSNEELDTPRNHTLLKEVYDGHTRLPYDNVACFFRIAGYAALVPGKHDFYYGAERLRAMARFLASSKQLDGLEPVHMLGANLIMETRDPDSTSHRRFDPRQHAYVIESTGFKADLPDTVLPWIRDFRVTGSPKSAWICEGTSLDSGGATNNDPFDFQPPGERGAHCERLSAQEKGRYHRDGIDLPPNWHYAVCLELPLLPNGTLAKPAYFCKPFTVAAPFFQYQNGPRRDGEAVPDAYALKHIRAGAQEETIAVFGVVDPQLPEHIGALNDSWLHDPPHDHFETQMKAIDPKAALQQVMQKCAADDECRNARKILLAQMSPSKAAQLVARLREGWSAETREGQTADAAGAKDIVPTDGSRNDWFEVVLSEADEELATGTEVRQKAKVPGRPLVPFLVIPAPLNDATTSKSPDCGIVSPTQPRCVRVTVEHADVRTDLQPQPVWRVEHSRADVYRSLPIDTGGATDPLLGTAAGEALESMFSTLHGDPKNAEQVLQQLALGVMRERGGHADVAMIQKRDLFFAAWHAGQHVNAMTLQSLLDRVFWKGDIVLNVAVTGATIKQMMKHSQEYESDDNNVLSTTDEVGRSLITLGLQMDPASHSYFINGQPIDDGRMYAVAVTDFIGEGDTGYSELFAKPPVPPDPLRKLAAFIPLSTAVCQQIATAKSLQKMGKPTCHTPRGVTLSADRQLDGSDQLPSDMTSGPGMWASLANWFKLSWPTSPIDGKSSEAWVQDRPVWRIVLDKAEISYNKNSHPDPKDYAGLSLPPFTSAASGSIAYSYQVRVIQEGRLLDRFTNSDFSYARETTVQPGKASIVNQKSNALNIEAGYYIHLQPRHKQPGGLKLIAGGRAELQPVSPLVVLPAPASFAFNTNRRMGWFGRTGLRLEGTKRWIEGGIQGGELVDSIYGYMFGESTCLLGAGSGNLTDCLKANQITSFVQPTVLARNRSQWSAFLSAHGELPLGTAKLVLEDKSQWVRDNRGDTSLNTNQLHDATATLKVPLWGNLTLAPKIEWLLFQNKVHYDTIQAFETAISLSYRFDWHYGAGLGRALRYANPATGQ